MVSICGGEKNRITHCSSLYLKFWYSMHNGSSRKSILNTHWKVWCWSWNSSTWPSYVKSQFIGTDSDAGKDWRQEEKEVTEDNMIGCHHWLNGHDLEQPLGDSEGPGSLVFCSLWGHKESNNLETEKQQEMDFYIFIKM